MSNYDVIIIGAGLGIFAAYELAEKKATGIEGGGI